MIDPPKTKAEAQAYLYGSYRRAYNTQKCACEVYEPGRVRLSKQCTRKPGFGPDGLYCKQHDPAEIARRRKASMDKYNAKMKRERPQWYAGEMLALLKEAPELEDVQAVRIDWLNRRNALLKKIEGN